MRFLYLKIYLFFVTFIFIPLGFAQLSNSSVQWPLVAREVNSQYISQKSLERESRYWIKRNLTQDEKFAQIVEHLDAGKMDSQSLLRNLLAIKSIKNEIELCSEPYIYQNASYENKLKIDNCKKDILNSVIIFLRAKFWIDDTAVIIIQAYIEQDQSQLGWLKSKNIDLPSLFENLNIVRNIRIKNGITETPSPLSEKQFVQKSKVWGKITARQELYLNYNYFEMKSLSLMLEDMEKQITSKYSARIFDYDGDGTIDLTVESTPDDKYDDAFDILKRHKDEAINNQGLLAGHAIKDIHLLAAASELKVPDEIITELLKIPGLKWKRDNKTDKYLLVAWSIGKTALMASPAGIYFILPIILVESFIQSKSKENE